VADDVHIGNFVELKATRMGRGAKAPPRLSRDSDIGARSNIGAGTIAVNYDGFGKWRTVICNCTAASRWLHGQCGRAPQRAVGADEGVIAITVRHLPKPS